MSESNLHPLMGSILSGAMTAQLVAAEAVQEPQIVDPCPACGAPGNYLGSRSGHDHHYRCNRCHMAYVADELPQELLGLRDMGDED